MAESKYATNFTLCPLCEERDVVNYCRNCTRKLCKSCTKIHIKTSYECQEDHFMEISTLKAQQQQTLNTIDAKIKAVKNRIEKKLESQQQFYQLEKERKIEDCLEAKEDIIKKLEEHFNGQKSKISQVSQVRVAKAKSFAESTEEILENIAKDFKALKEKDWIELAPTWEEVTDKLQNRLEVLNQSSSIKDRDNKVILINNKELNSSAFDVSKAFTVLAENTEGKAELQARFYEENAPTFDWIKTANQLRLLHQTEIYGHVTSMQLFNNQLWCLMQDHIKICDLNGQTVQTIHDVNGGEAMVKHMNKYMLVLVSSQILVFNQSGKQIHTFKTKCSSYNTVCSYNDLVFVINMSGDNYGSVTSYSILDGKFLRHLSMNFSTDSSHSAQNSSGIITRSQDMYFAGNYYYYSSSKQFYKLTSTDGNLKFLSNKDNKYTITKVCDTDGNQPLFFLKDQESTCITFAPDMNNPIKLPVDEIQNMTWVTCDNARQRMYMAVTGTVFTPSAIKVFGL